MHAHPGIDVTATTEYCSVVICDNPVLRYDKGLMASLDHQMEPSLRSTLQDEMQQRVVPAASIWQFLCSYLMRQEPIWSA